MAYLYNSTNISGSNIQFTKDAKPVLLKSTVLNNSTTGSYTLLSGNQDYGNFIPTRVYFHYNTADGTSVSRCRFNLGFNPPGYNDFITSGSLTIDGSAGVKTNVVEQFATFTVDGTMSGSSNLILTIPSLGTNKVTGSFIVEGYFLEY